MVGRMKIPRWAQLILGGWVLVSPWILGFSGISIMMWSNVIAGTVIVLLEVWILFDAREEDVPPQS